MLLDICIFSLTVVHSYFIIAGLWCWHAPINSSFLPAINMVSTRGRSLLSDITATAHVIVVAVVYIVCWHSE